MQLRGHVGSVDITPEGVPGIRLGGFGFNRRATAVLHPLEAGVLYLTDGEEEVALVTVDSVGLFRPWVQRIRARVTHMRDRDRVLICATHSHAAPDTLGYWGPSFLGVLPTGSGVDPAYMELLVTRIAGAVDEAVAAAAPVQLRAAGFAVEPGLFTNHRKGGALDDRGVVLCIDDAHGAPRGVLLNFAAHPEGLWDKNKRVSPDYPHHAREVLRERGLGVPVFFSGALGGMLTPDIPVKAKTDVREKEIERIGRALGAAAADAAVDAPPLADPRLQVRSTRVYLPFANWRFTMAQRLGIFTRSLTDGEIRSEVNLVDLGGLRALTLPGEALPELGQLFQAVLAEKAPEGALGVLLCLGCDELGYLLPAAKWDEREYRYEVSMSVGRDAAPRLLSAARSLVESL